jgi:hypothetical protein
MAAPSLTYTLTNGQTADATQVMQNFNDLLNGITDGTKDLSISALTVAGTATLNGAINLGNASADDITVTGSLASTIPVKTTASYDIGSSTLGLRSIYIGANSQSVRLLGSASMSATWTLTLPVTAGTANYMLLTDGAGVTSWSSWTNSAHYADGSNAGTLSATTQTIGGAKTFTAATTTFNGTGNTVAEIKAPTSSNAALYLTYNTSTTAIGIAGSSDTFVTGSVAGDTCLAAINSLLFGVNGAATKVGGCSSAGAWTLGVSSAAVTHTIQSAQTSGAAFRVLQACATAGSGARVIDANYTADNDCSGGYFFSCINQAGSIIGKASATTNTVILWDTSSDERLKQNFETFEALPLIDKMEMGTFEFKENPGVRIHGAYAQRLHAVYPDAVSVGSDKRTESGGLAEPWGVDYGRLTPVLVKAVQELKAQLAAALARIATLECV